MFVYRLASLPLYELTSISYQLLRRRLRESNMFKTGGYGPPALDADRDEFYRLIEIIGWNKTVSRELMVFTGINPLNFTPGFVLKQATDGRVFVGSPGELAYLVLHAEDRTDSDEKARTIANMSGETWFEGEPIIHPGWRTSSKGNLWTTMAGTNVVVLTGPTYGTFVGLLRGDNNKRIVTHEFNSVSEVQNYLERQYWNLVKVWEPPKDDDTNEDNFYFADDE